MSGVFILLDSDQTGSGILFLQKARDLGLRPILASERPESFRGYGIRARETSADVR